MADRHTLEELNNCSREELITIVLMMQGQLDTPVSYTHLSPITTIRSTSRYSASSRRCSMMITVLSRSRQIRSIKSIARLPVAGSRFASGSSNKRMSTSSTKTPAMETRCFCPPDSSVGAWLKSVLISTTSATSSTRRNISSCATQSFSSAKATSSATVSPINCPSVSCSRCV